MRTVRLQKKLEHAVVAGHPWIYRDALVPARVEPGEVVTVLSRGGKFLARGAADDGPIAVRVWTTEDRPLDAALIASRIATACELRDRGVPEKTTAYRLLHGEGDRMPGLVCDVYGDVAVVRPDGAGVARKLDVVLEVLSPTLRKRGVRTLLHRAGKAESRDVRVVWGAAVVGELEVQENGMRLVVDVLKGQKTGLFLDQRDSRLVARQWASGRRVLNLYAYTGGFSVAAALGGADRVTTVDVARAALDLSARSFEVNGLDSSRHRICPGKVEAFMKTEVKLGEYNFVISDPPSFAPKETSKRAALDAYQALHTSVLSMLESDALYLAASCSSHISRLEFEDSLLSAARATRRVLQVVGRWQAPSDHPTLLAFPEGNYLKAVLVRVVR